MCMYTVLSLVPVCAFPFFNNFQHLYNTLSFIISSCTLVKEISDKNKKDFKW